MKKLITPKKAIWFAPLALAGGIVVANRDSVPPPTPEQVQVAELSEAPPQPGAPTPDYRLGVIVDDFRLPEDPDDHASFQRAEAAAGNAGTILALGRTYYTSETIEIANQIRLVGLSSYQTRIKATGLKTALRFVHRWEAEHRGMGLGADGAEVVGVEILEETGGIPRPSHFRVGLDVDASVYLSDVSIKGFTHGVLADCGALRGVPPGHRCAQDPSLCLEAQNCNYVHADRLRVTGSEHAAIVFQGPDANAGTIMRSSFVTNCRHAEKIAAISADLDAIPTRAKHLYRTTAGDSVCAHEIDASFLGNTWFANHLSIAVEKDTGKRHLDSWHDDPNGNQRGVRISNYAESGSHSDGAKNILTLGGLESVRGGGLSIRDGVISNSTLVSTTLDFSESVVDSVGEHELLRINAGGSDWFSVVLVNEESGGNLKRRGLFARYKGLSSKTVGFWTGTDWVSTEYGNEFPPDYTFPAFPWVNNKSGPGNTKANQDDVHTIAARMYVIVAKLRAAGIDL